VKYRSQLDQLIARLRREQLQPKQGLKVDDRVWMVQHGQRVVHIVLALHGEVGEVAEMVCGMFGELARPKTRKRTHPFITKTTAPVTCVFCLPEDHAPPQS